MLIECKVKYGKLVDGLSKSVKETYLVEADNIAEAESKIVENLKPFVSGEFEIIATKKYKCAERFGSAGDYYYVAKVSMILLDEKTGVEKSKVSTMLVCAENFDAAYTTLLEELDGSMTDWSLESLTKSAIIDIFK